MFSYMTVNSSNVHSPCPLGKLGILEILIKGVKPGEELKSGELGSDLDSFTEGLQKNCCFSLASSSLYKRLFADSKEIFPLTGEKRSYTNLSSSF